LGWREDIYELMQLSDIFVFPRLEVPKEGLGMVVIEAQAAGIPMILSYGIVKDAIIIPENTLFLKYDSNAENWAQAIESVLDSSKKPHYSECLSRMKSSHFELKKATDNLLKLYEY
jgi:glycosyltransferase involved in cell wall biosynthesis